jgi:hypothetical protein
VKYFAIPSWGNTFLSPLKKEVKTDPKGFFNPEGKPIDYPKDKPWWDRDAWRENYGDTDENKKKWDEWKTKPTQTTPLPKVVTR